MDACCTAQGGRGGANTQCQHTTSPLLSWTPHTPLPCTHLWWPPRLGKTRSSSGQVFSRSTVVAGSSFSGGGPAQVMDRQDSMLTRCALDAVCSPKSDAVCSSHADSASVTQEPWLTVNRAGVARHRIQNSHCDSKQQLARACKATCHQLHTICLHRLAASCCYCCAWLSPMPMGGPKPPLNGGPIGPGGPPYAPLGPSIMGGGPNRPLGPPQPRLS